MFLKSLTRLPQGATGVPPVRLKILLRPWRLLLNGECWAALDTVHLQFECTPHAESLIKKMKRRHCLRPQTTVFYGCLEELGPSVSYFLQRGLGASTGYGSPCCCLHAWRRCNKKPSAIRDVTNGFMET